MPAPRRSARASPLLDCRHRPILLAGSGPGAIALPQPRTAQLREAAHRAGVLRAGIAVAEVARQVEAQLLGETHRLAHRVGVLGEARRHRRGGGQHMAVVAAPQWLAGVERGAVAQRHEGVLQLRAAARVGVDVAAGHARHPEAPGERRSARLRARSWRA